MDASADDTYQSFEDIRRSLLANEMGHSSSIENEINDVGNNDVVDTEINGSIQHQRHHSSNNTLRMIETTTSLPSSSSSWYQNTHQITAMISNFSTSYNVVNISLVLPILEQIYENASSEDAAACASSLLAGMIVGQLLGGILGDSWLGRLGALRLVMALQIIASLASALFGVTQSNKELSHEDIFLWLAGWRFVLGIGCGGVYPLAAVLSAEQGKDGHSLTIPTTPSSSQQDGVHINGSSSNNEEEKDDNADSIHRVVLTFSTQGIGFVAVPIVAVILLNSTSSLHFVWRAILGFGSIPGIFLMLLQCRCSHRQHRSHLIPTEDPLHHQSEELQQQEDNENDVASTTDENENEPMHLQQQDTREENEVDVVVQGHRSWLQTLFHEPGLGRKLLGTAGTWFLFDVVFYGNTIFQPIVVEAAFGGKGNGSGIELLHKTAMDSLILTSIALPGYAVAGAIMGKKTWCCTQTPRYVMLQGFAAMGVLYATIGINWSYLRGYPAMLVLLYGMTFFFANYGPNTTTFILPSLTFEKEHRSTLNGVSAAAGKLGALTGATLFEPAADALGDNAVMLICAAVAIIGYILTYCTVPKQETLRSRQDDASDIVFNESNSEVV